MDATKSYDEIIDFIAAGTTPEAVVAFRPSEAVQQSVAELVERSKDGSISIEERSELDDYLQLEHIRAHHDHGEGARTPIHSPWEVT